ncbi:MAG: hypothetical protein H6708_13265 [Kofleriaceae bacterium]|nr:hypothetical protein [Kofleriaceae bacterium]
MFASVIDVAAADVWPAIRAVWASALGPLAAAYGRGRTVDVAVILQRAVTGRRLTIYTRAPGRPDDDEAWLEAEDAPLVRARRGDDAPHLTLALAAERAIGATGGADVELIVGDDGASWLVQARPIVHPAPARARRAAPPASLLTTRARRRRAGAGTSSTTPIRCRRRRPGWSRR